MKRLAHPGSSDRGANYPTSTEALAEGLAARKLCARLRAPTE